MKAADEFVFNPVRQFRKLKEIYALSGLSLVAQAAVRLVPRPGKPCKNQNKKFQTHS